MASLRSLARLLERTLSEDDDDDEDDEDDDDDDEDDERRLLLRRGLILITFLVANICSMSLYGANKKTGGIRATAHSFHKSRCALVS
jgi:hypothetical protein